MDRRTFIHATAASAACASLVSADTQEKPVRVAMIGVAHSHAIGKLQAMLDLSDYFEVVGIAENNPEARKKLEANAGLRAIPLLQEEELFATKDLQAVVVETRVRDLVPTGQRVIDAGYALHLEKPAGESLSEFEKLLNVARTKSLHVQLGYMLRYNPGIAFAKEVVDTGALGDVFEVDCSFGKLVGSDERRELAEFHGGAMYELGCHLIDAITTIFGMPERVTAYDRRSGNEPANLADNQIAVLEYPRKIVTVRAAVIDPHGNDRRHLSIHGSNGSLELRPIERNQPRLTLVKAAGSYPAGLTQPKWNAPQGRYHEQMRHFAMVLRGQQSTQWSYEHDLQTHRVILKAAGYKV